MRASRAGQTSLSFGYAKTELPAVSPQVGSGRRSALCGARDSAVHFCDHLNIHLSGAQFNWGKNPGKNPGENPDENTGESPVKKLQ